MKTILFAVDDRKGTVTAANTLLKYCSTATPEQEVVLVYVEKMHGQSIVGEALENDSDMEELRLALKDTDYQQLLDKKADKIIAFYTKLLGEAGVTAIRSVVRQGHPAEEILAVAEQEGADLIVVGSRSNRRFDFLLGSVSREVANLAPIPVLLAR